MGIVSFVMFVIARTDGLNMSANSTSEQEAKRNEKSQWLRLQSVVVEELVSG